ncbi:hypothetical protein E1287_25885 [Actinomadura sp. KC06]|uniref:DUF6493 family protein n=1 Tax=Actinomadura sp. KC06 TaxID=2530369 RepID=UPI0010506D90|nr:DUF6493 family protein [Actinomadura sp. KC06]TDD31596.1 hypothetical protein E1287_25885 [Actinomadura sp. KC06]
MPSPTHLPVLDGDRAWETIAALIDERKPDAVADAVRDLDAAGRRAVARALPGHLRLLRARREPWEGIDDYAPAFRAAGAGTLTGASAVATWLNRREFNTRWFGDHDDTALLLDLWADRDDAWLADLARRLTLRLRGPRHIGLDLVLALLTETGIEPPEHDPLVVGWVSSAPPRPKDPLLPFLLPRVFEADGVGRRLRDNPSWPRTLATLADRGVVGRRMLLDGCVRRFLRGGTANDLRFFVRLHGLLMPDDPAAREREIREHALDYVRLLPAAPGPVADVALGLLREVPGLPSEQVVEALDGVLFRAESGLVKSGLSWLEQTVQRRPGLAGDCAAALAQAFAHTSYSVQQRAVRVALKLPAAADGTPITGAVPLLPPDLGAEAAARFGGDVARPEPADEPPPLIAPVTPAPGPLPPPITTAAELAAGIHDAELDWAGIERMLAAFAELTWRDAEGVRAALAPVVQRENFYPRLDDAPRWTWADHWLLAAARRLTRTVPLPPDWRQRVPSPGQVIGPHLLYLSRCAEIVAAVEHDALPPLLLATPTEPTGHLDPATFVDRLEVLQDAGADPGPADLQQALLRLPRDLGPEAARRAAALSSPAGRTAARWLAAGGLPVPVVSMRPFAGGAPEAVISAPPTGLPLVDAVFTAPPRNIGWEHGWYKPTWPRLLPSHPEVAAAHVLPHLGPTRYPFGTGMSVGAFVEVTRGDGPFAEAVGHFLARELVQRRHDQADGALLTMAARGDLPAAELGRHIGRLALDGEIQPVRIIEALERAAEAGAYAQIWDVIAAALPVLCPEPGERPVHGLKRLIALGRRTARWSGARGAIPEVEVLAARKGSSDLVREARALAAQLQA